MDLLNLYYNSTGFSSCSDAVNKNFKNEKFGAYKYNNKGKFTVNRYTWCIYTNSLYVTWDEQKNSIKISTPDVNTIYYKKNVFIEKTHIWKVIYLDKKGKSKIKTTFDNGNIYEITFN